MYYFMFDAAPSPSNPDSATVGGAYIICWIDSPTLSEAEAAARQSIEEANWQIVSLEESRIVERQDYDDNPEGLQYFEEAATDGAVFVYHGYPPE